MEEQIVKKDSAIYGIDRLQGLISVGAGQRWRWFSDGVGMDIGKDHHQRAWGRREHMRFGWRQLFRFILEGPDVFFFSADVGLRLFV